MTRSSDDKRSTGDDCDVVIIGGGPAGLSAATELKRLGVARVRVLEREPQAGGIPRHCGHPPFGMREFSRLLTGPEYARRLVDRARRAGVEIATSTSVVEVRTGGQLLTTSRHGVAEITARRVLIATGVRETPRSARLISGARPAGVINTGALQSLVYLQRRRPFLRPVIIGTELVSFSAIQTCRHGGIVPVAMVEAGQQVTARWPAALFARLARVPLHLGTRLLGIEGERRVTAALIGDPAGGQRRIECDGVLLTGRFTPEATLARSGHLAVDPATGGPLVDQFGRCSDAAYFAAGNILRPVETAGWSWNEGRQAAQWIVQDLAGGLPAAQQSMSITASGPLIKYVLPQRVALPWTAQGMNRLQFRFWRSESGELTASCGARVVWRRRLKVHPERRLLVPLEGIVRQCQGADVEFRFICSTS